MKLSTTLKSKTALREGAYIGLAGAEPDTTAQAAIDCDSVAGKDAVVGCKTLTKSSQPACSGNMVASVAMSASAKRGNDHELRVLCRMCRRY